MAENEAPGRLNSKVLAGSLLRLVSALASAVMVAFLRLYKMCISPLLPRACRFHPSCSSYAVEAISAWGPWRGALMSAFRVLRCHPFHPGGYDPVPPCGNARRESTEG